MTDGAIGPDVLMTLVNRMIGTGQEKEIPAPPLPHMDQGDIFRRPRIKLIDGIERRNRPFLDVTDDILSRRDWFQSKSRQPFPDCECVLKTQWRRRFPPPLSHGSFPLVRPEIRGSTIRTPTPASPPSDSMEVPPAHFCRTDLNALRSIIVSPSSRSIPSRKVAESCSCTSSLLNQKTVRERAPSTLRIVVL